jgi:hypothetical protein
MTARASMPPHAVSHLERLLAEHAGLDHLAVQRRGRSLTLCSEDAYGPTRHAKLDWLGAELWGLSLPTHTGRIGREALDLGVVLLGVAAGRWEKTPFTGSLDEILQTLIHMLPFHLAAR